MKDLPKVTFTNNDHTKVKRAMTMYDPMKNLLISLWRLHYDGKDTSQMSERTKMIVRELGEIQKYLE